MHTAATLLLAALSQYPTLPGEPGLVCYSYRDFADTIAAGGARLTQTIETPSFPEIKRLLIVTYKGTKQVFGAYQDCVVVPPLFVDYPDGTSPVPLIQFLPNPAL